MGGAPLEEAKRCARNMIDGLAPGDRAAIFSFDDEIERVAPLTPATDKLALAAALAGIQSGGSTNLHGGWHAGAEELAGQLAGDDVHRVILLSDGGANAGETDLEEIARQCKVFAQRGVSTSTYGLGEQFNEQLMLAMAAAGRGNAYYGQTAADLAEPFAAEFALLASLCARGLVLKVNAPAGVGVKIRNDYEPVEGEAMAWRLPTSRSRRGVGAAGVRDPGSRRQRQVRVDSDHGVGAGGDAGKLAALPDGGAAAVARDDRGTAASAAGRRARGAGTLELAAAEALEEVRVAIEADNWERAKRLVDDAATRFGAHEWAAAILATMRRLVGERDKWLAMKEASFSRRSMNQRLASRSEALYCLEDEPSIPSFLRRKPEQGKGRPRFENPG